MNLMQLLLTDPSIWKEELAQRDLVTVSSDSIIQLAVSTSSIENGQPMVTFRLDMPDGKVLLVKTSMEGFITAAAEMIQAYQQDLPPEEEQH